MTPETITEEPQDVFANTTGDLGGDVFANTTGSMEVETAEWFHKNLETLHKAALDPDNFFKGKDLSFARSPKEAASIALTDSYLALMNGGESPGGGELGRKLWRDEVARERFGGFGVGDDAAFHGEILKEAQKGKTKRDLVADLTGAAGKGLYESPAGKTAILSGALGKPIGSGFAMWRAEAMKKPGYDTADDANYLEIYNAVQKEVTGALAPVLGSAADVFASMQRGDLDFWTAYGELDGDVESQQKLLAAITVLARTLPPEQQATVWGNFEKQVSRTADDLPSKIFSGLRNMVRGSGDNARLDEVRAEMAKQEFGGEGDPRTRKERDIQDRNFVADLRRIRDDSYDPIKVLHPEGFFSRVGEKALYAAPESVSYLAMAAASHAVGAGPMFMAGINEDVAYDSVRDSILKAGGSDQVASSFAYDAAPVIAVPYTAIDYLEGAALLKKVPFLEEALKKATNKMGSAALRFGTRVAGTAAFETVPEFAQDTLPPLVQEMASALDKDVPGTVWKNGKYGYLDGFWENQAVTFLSMLPLSVGAGFGGAQRDTRARAHADATDTQLQAFGYSPALISDMRAAQAQGLASLNAVIDRAEPARDPFSDTAKAATERLIEEAKAQQAAAAEAQRSGVLPRFLRDANGWTVFDGETGEEVGKAATAGDAMRLGVAHSEAIDESNADQTAFLFSMLEAGDKTAETAGTSFDFRPGERVTATQKAAESEIDEARVLAQTAAKEALGDSGRFSDIVLGQSVTEFKQRARETVNRINAGGAALTVFHEETHGFFREALASGRLTRDETIAAVRALDAVLGGKTTKAGQALKFLPDGEVSDVQLDEAVSELMEAEILRTRKTGGARNVAPGIVTRNLTAMARLAPGAAKKLSRFISTVRAFWGVAFHRAAAIKKGIREGSIKEADIEAFTAKLFGLNDQDIHDAAAAKVAEEITGDAASFSIGSSQMADAVSPFYSAMARTIEAKLPSMATPEQALAIARTAKAEEVKWSGIEQAIPRIAAENGGKVPKAALLDYLRADGSVRLEEVTGRYEDAEPTDSTEVFESDGPPGFKPLYAGYKTPGGTNYREVVLAMPVDSDRIHEEADKTEDGTYRSALAKLTYTSSHFPDVTNYVAHMRLQDFGDGTLIEEIQSDRHQAGRKSGYKTGVPTGTFPQWMEAKGLGDQAQAEWNNRNDSLLFQQYLAETRREKDAPALAPFTKDWPIQMFKRALRDAVEAGRTWIGWTTGATQGDRFDLSKQVDAISVDRISNDRFIVKVKPKGATEWQDAGERGMSASALADTIGKDLAQKVADGTSDDNPRMQFSGDGLKTEAAGMIGFYDKILPAEVGKYVKQWGAKVESGEVNIGGGKPTAYADFADYMAKKDGATQAIHRVSITPAMRASVQDGQPLFALGPAEMADILINQAQANVKSPKPRMALLASIVAKLGELRNLSNQVSVPQATPRQVTERFSNAEQEAALQELDQEREQAQDAHEQALRELKDEREGARQDARAAMLEALGPDTGKTADERKAAREARRQAVAKADSDYKAAVEKENARHAKETAKIDAKESKLAARGAVSDAVLRTETRAEQELADTRNTLRAQAAQQRQDTLNALAMLDGILAALPTELRGKVGGFTALAKLTTNEARTKYLQSRIAKLDEVVESFLRKEYGKLMKKLLERAKPAKDGAGKKMVGKAGADIHALFDNLRAAMAMDETQVQARIAAIDSEINDPNNPPPPEREAHLILERGLTELMGDWNAKIDWIPVLDAQGNPVLNANGTATYKRNNLSPGADAARRAAAVESASFVLDEGYAKEKLKRLMQKEDRDIRRGNFKADTGKQGTAAERDAKLASEQGLPAKWKNSMLSLSSFEQALHYLFGEKSTEAERLADMERAAAYQKEDAVQAKMDGLDGLFTGIAGSELAGQQLRFDMDQKSFDAGTRRLSQMEGIAVTLMWRQADGRRHMIGRLDENAQPAGPWHYDQAFVDQVESALTPEALAVRAYLAAEYAAEYEVLNPVFRELNGINLPKNGNYSPVTVTPQQATAGQVTNPVTGFAGNASGTTPGSLLTRSTSAVAEPDFRSAIQTYIAHTKEIQHYLAYASFSSEAQAILGNREIGNAIESKGGKQGLTVLRQWLDMFAQGGVRDAQAQLALNGFMNRLTSRAAGMALVGRMGVLAVQSTQLGAALAEMPTGSYVKRLGKLFTGQLGWGAAKKSEFIQRRIKQMPPIVQQAMAGLMSAEPNRVKYWVQKMGTWISGADGLFTAGTFAMVHDYQLNVVAKEMGLSGQAAEDYAAAAAERVTERIAQPTRAGTRSLFENGLTSPLARTSWAFASEARQKLMLSAWALANKPLGAKMRALAVTWIIGGMGAALIRAAIRDAKDDDDELWDEKNWGAKRLALSSLTGPLGGVPLLGDALEAGIYKAAGEYLPEGNLISGLGASFKAASRVSDWGDSKPDEIMRDADNLISGIGLFNDTIAATASLAHLARDLFGVVENIAD